MFGKKKVFYNIDRSVQPKTFWDAAKWYRNAPPNPWPGYVPLEKADAPPMRVMDHTFRVSWVGHMTFLVQTQGFNILTDPIWSEVAGPWGWAGPKRVTPPGIAWNDLPPIDLVLVSHNHYDHMDIPTLHRLWERDKPKIVTPLGNDRILMKHIAGITVHTLDWEQSVTLQRDLTVHCLPAQHWSARSLWDKNQALWATLIVSTPAGDVCFIGDTGYDVNIFKRIGIEHPRIQLALLPIGAFEPRWFMGQMHVNPEEAIKIYQDLRAAYAIGGHFECFKLADDRYLQAATELVQARDQYKVDATRFVVPKIGGVYQYEAHAVR